MKTVISTHVFLSMNGALIQQGCCFDTSHRIKSTILSPLFAQNPHDGVFVLAIETWPDTSLGEIIYICVHLNAKKMLEYNAGLCL